MISSVISKFTYNDSRTTVVIDIFDDFEQLIVMYCLDNFPEVYKLFVASSTRNKILGTFARTASVV